MWKQVQGVSQRRDPKSDENKRIFEYCVVSGVLFISYSDYNAYNRGDHPMTVYKIVGASASAPSSGGDTSLNTTFRMVTSQGTHLYCTAPTPTDCNTWLATLHAGLEAMYMAASLEMPILKPVSRESSSNRGMFREKQILCTSCGRSCEVITLSTPLPQYGYERRCHVCPECLVSQGVWLDVQLRNQLYATYQYEQQALNNARDECYEVIHEGGIVEIKFNEATLPTVSQANALRDLISSIDFLAYRRACPELDRWCSELELGQLDASEFIDLLDDTPNTHMAELKKQAFRVAGDMGSAMKLLADYTFTNDVDMFRQILDFFLDLCDEGDLSSVAFFWPQLQSLHLKMLPPRDSKELIRVELMEDFLLTIAVKYSIQLALEVTWAYVADLEDSLFNSNISPPTRRRRFSVLRFVCELESLLFDFQDGWGGGSVSLRSMLTPSKHQVILLKDEMMHLTQTRKKLSNIFLSRSTRVEKLSDLKFTKPPEEAAEDALKAAKYADYFSSHLSFTRRICDVAEKLRFLDVSKRPAVLQKEMDILNSSGSMGGDPLNRVKDGLVRIVRVPSKEGHVFRSKERTPILLLMEVIEELEPVASKEKDIDERLQEQSERGVRRDGLSAEEAVLRRNSNNYAVDLELPGSDEGSASNRIRSKSEEDDVDSAKEKIVAQEREKTVVEPEKDTDNAKIWLKGNIDAERLEETVINESKHLAAVETKENTDDAKLWLNSEGNLDAGRGEKQDYEEEKLETQLNQKNMNNVQAGETKVSDNRDVKECDEQVALSEAGKNVDCADLLNGNFERQSTEEECQQLNSIDMENSSSRIPPSPRALTKFKQLESPENREEGRIEPETPSKEAMEMLVIDVMNQQLNVPQLTTFAREESEDDSVKDKISKGVSASNKTLTNRKMTALGEADHKSNQLSEDIKRNVLTTIMSKSLRGSNAIAAGAAVAAQKSLQELDRKRAVELMLNAKAVPQEEISGGEAEEAELQRQKMIDLCVNDSSKGSSVGLDGNEDDEAIESLRLLLIQEKKSKEKDEDPMGIKVSNSSSLRNANGSLDGPIDKSDVIEIDAGDVDPRLAGCGVLPPAVLSALTLWKGGVVTNAELLELVKKDLQFIRHSDNPSADVGEDNSEFWGRFAFGERWAEKKARIAACSPEGYDEGWDLHGVIVKSNDDLRQEAFVMQLIELCREAFELAELELWVHPYRILATGRTTGIIECVKNAMSFDGLKKRRGFKDGLRGHLERMAEFSSNPGEAFKTMQHNFVRSLASYSLMSYLFLFKDRHNGNILLDTAGHVIHIDFGFVFGIAPGGSFSLEMSTPFKITDEMLEVMGGMQSPFFSEFVTLFCCGFLALRAHMDTFLTIVEITCKTSSFKCFEGRESSEVVEKLRSRFCPDLSKETAVAFALDLIKQSTQSFGTKQYDYFQYLSQGIAT